LIHIKIIRNISICQRTRRLWISMRFVPMEFCKKILKWVHPNMKMVKRENLCVKYNSLCHFVCVKTVFGRLVISIQLVDLLLRFRKYNKRYNWKSTHNDGGNKTKLLRQQNSFLDLKCKQSNDFHSKCALAVFSIVILLPW